MLDNLQRFYNKLLNRIFMLLARGVLKAVNDSGKTQKVQIICLAGETISDVERFEQYGLSTYPLADAETFTAFLNGNRSQGIVLCVHDRRYRPNYLASGEVCIYTSLDKTSPHRIHLKADGSIEVYGNVKVNGNMVASGDVSDESGTAQTMVAMRTIFNAHVHTCAAPGNPSTPPTTSM